MAAGATLVVWAGLFVAERAGDVPRLGSWVALAAGSVVVWVVHRLRQLAERTAAAEAELAERLTWTSLDPLTGLANRAGITADIENRLERRHPGGGLVGVLFCDLDRFQLVNDSLGHDRGDDVLVLVGDRLSGVVRDTDTLGRFAGDQFVVVASGLPTPRDLEILADRLIDALTAPMTLGDETSLVLSGSVGMASVAGSAQATSGELLRDADLALSRAKGLGGGRSSYFDETLRVTALARADLERELRQAIGSGQLTVHYQPLVDVETGDIDRAEALVRWNHPDRGTILPSEFLPVAAESSLMLDLGEVVLRQACAQAVQWSTEANRPISVAVNLAERQLHDPALADRVAAVLADTGLAPNQLQFEVGDRLVLERSEQSLVALRQLDLLGVDLAVDHVGTSHLSLAGLDDIGPVSTVKLARQLVAGMVDDQVDHKIVEAIVALASRAGMVVVAEGVETRDQASRLIDAGVDRLQGFLFGRPDQADVIGRLFAPDHRPPWGAFAPTEVEIDQAQLDQAQLDQAQLDRAEARGADASQPGLVQPAGASPPASLR